VRLSPQLASSRRLPQTHAIARHQAYHVDHLPSRTLMICRPAAVDEPPADDQFAASSECGRCGPTGCRLTIELAPMSRLVRYWRV
jgi:hypothetical protein